MTPPVSVVMFVLLKPNRKKAVQESHKTGEFANLRTAIQLLLVQVGLLRRHPNYTRLLVFATSDLMHSRRLAIAQVVVHHLNLGQRDRET